MVADWNGRGLAPAPPDGWIEDDLSVR
jgi:hypothetical protein